MKTTHPVIIGIDTHKAIHVAVAIDTQGTRLAALSIPTSPKGYLELERWSRSLGHVLAFGIEETGSYGAGLSRSLLAQGRNVIEVTRPNHQLRYAIKGAAPNRDRSIIHMNDRIGPSVSEIWRIVLV